MVVAALAAYKHDTLGRYLPTVLHFSLQATLFLQKFWVSNAIRSSLSTPKIIQPPFFQVSFDFFLTLN